MSNGFLSSGVGLLRFAVRGRAAWFWSGCFS